MTVWRILATFNRLQSLPFRRESIKIRVGGSDHLIPWCLTVSGSLCADVR